LCLVVNSILIIIVGNAGLVFMVLGTTLSIYFAYLAYNLTKTKSSDDAWALFKFSNAYLFSLFIFLVFDTAYLL